jgi:hypothetical protein
MSVTQCRRKGMSASGDRVGPAVKIFSRPNFGSPVWEEGGAPRGPGPRPLSALPYGQTLAAD